MAEPPAVGEAKGLSATSKPESNYELFNCNSISIRYWSWNYRGCWHQTCPPIVFIDGFRYHPLQSPQLV